MKETFFTLHEVAKTLKISYMTVFRWVKAGKISAYKFEKQYRIKETELEKFIEESKTK